MKTNFYDTRDPFLTGMTLKDHQMFENNNLALHVTKYPQHTVENRKHFADLIHYSLDDFVCGEQTHSANFHKVVLADKGAGAYTMKTAIPNTDALYTFEENIVLCTFSADCVPVIFYDHVSGVIGVIHSGWPGTIKEITPKTLQQLFKNEGVQPELLQVHFGAAISQEKFEVDTDVYEKFKALGYANEFIYFNAETGKYHIDNQRTIQKQCELSGVPSKNITIEQTCTFKSKDHFSYRQDKKTGRHLSFIVKKGE